MNPANRHPITTARAADPRPFNLLLYLSLTTGVTVALLGIGLWFTFTMIMNNSMLKISERYAMSIAQGLDTRLMQEYAGPEAVDIQIPALDQTADFQRFDQLVRKDMAAFNIEELKIYDTQSCILYSTEIEQIGRCDSINEHLQSALTGKPSAELQYSQEAGDLPGERIAVDAIETYVPVRASNGTVVRAFEIYQDVTEMRRSLLLTNVVVILVLLVAMGLFYIVQHGFAHQADFLIKQQRQILEERNRELEELEQLKTDLTNMIVHDMKSPLTAIMGYLKLLDRGIDRQTPEQNRMMVDQSYQASERLLDMIMNLLDISRIEEGQLTLKKEPIDMAALADIVVRPLTPAVQETDKSLTVELPDGLPPFEADQDMLRRILTNLLTNAIKHTDRGGKIALRAESHPGEIWISIQDNGEGIPAEAIPQLFRKFSQVKDKKLGQRTDTGLGLAFCKLAVEAHGGRIWVESQINRGSTFTFSLPLNH